MGLPRLRAQALEPPGRAGDLAEEELLVAVQGQGPADTRDLSSTRLRMSGSSMARPSPPKATSHGQGGVDQRSLGGTASVCRPGSAMVGVGKLTSPNLIGIRELVAAQLLLRDPRRQPVEERCGSSAMELVVLTGAIRVVDLDLPKVIHSWSGRLRLEDLDAARPSAAARLPPGVVGVLRTGVGLEQVGAADPSPEVLPERLPGAP